MTTISASEMGTRSAAPNGAQNGHESAADAADACLADHLSRPIGEQPPKPEWDPGPKPGFIGRRLIRMAGVDPGLARNMPAEEQQQMKRVGLALLFGVAFQAICFFTGFAIAFGPDPWIMPVTFVICGILYAYDSKFIASDWVAQGTSHCRSLGIMPRPNWRERMRRPMAVAVRWTMSLFIAATLAMFVLLKLFLPDIGRHWSSVNQKLNAPIAATATKRYEALVADLTNRIARSDVRLDTLNHERAGILEGAVSVPDLDRQIDDQLEHIKQLEAAKAEAERIILKHRQDAAAEQGGIRFNEGNTGHPGRGPYYEFHLAMAAEQQKIALARQADIDSAYEVIAKLRRQRTDILGSASAHTDAQVRAVEQHIAETIQTRAALAAEYRGLQDGRERWIDARMRESPEYTPMPEGILAKLEGLAAIIAGSALIAGLVFSTKILIMLLESAGPVAKVFFTAPGVYAISCALRFHDFAEYEGDRRVRWEYWRLATRDRAHEAIDAIKTARRRRDSARRGRDIFHDMFEKFSTVR